MSSNPPSEITIHFTRSKGKSGSCLPSMVFKKRLWHCTHSRESIPPVQHSYVIVSRCEKLYIYDVL